MSFPAELASPGIREMMAYMKQPTRHPGLRTDQVFRLPWTSPRRGLRFHVYARGIRWEEPVGVVWYFDGDYYLPVHSAVRHPTGPTLLRLAAIANARNLVFIAMDTPDRRYSTSGFTWWVRARLNGRVFRLFARSLRRRLHPDPSRSWVMGYSGGAEFITFDLLRRQVPRWLRGGAVMVGGGGVQKPPETPGPELRKIPLTWWIGQEDGDLAAAAPGLWSAQQAARTGCEAYRAAGFSHATLRELPETGHRSYDLPQILRETLDAAGLAPRQAPTETGTAETGPADAPTSASEQGI